MQGFFNLQQSNGDLTQDHYFSSPPIEQRSRDFCTTEKILPVSAGFEPTRMNCSEVWLTSEAAKDKIRFHPYDFLESYASSNAEHIGITRDIMEDNTRILFLVGCFQVV